MITEKQIENIINDTNQNKIEWFKTENTPCFDCETEDFGVIICKYNDAYNDDILTVSLTFTDDWGNEFTSKIFTEGAIFDKLNEFYDIVDTKATIEYL